MDDSIAYDEVVSKLRTFFHDEEGFIEVPAQSRKSIMAACEDPSTIATYEIGGGYWPLPQTGQMWLEHDLLKNPKLKGVFCVTHSYRDEKNPIPGRHEIMFPMFEFESSGDVEDLIKLERSLLSHLGFVGSPQTINYDDACRRFDVSILEDEHEGRLCETAGNKPVMLCEFPLRTHPFWNMKHTGDDIYAKVDVLLHGMETIGSAERSCDPEEMRHNFNTISGGEYSELLFNLFTEVRVRKELEVYLASEMFPRFGGGIGITRLARAMKLEGVLKADYEVIDSSGVAVSTSD